MVSCVGSAEQHRLQQAEMLIETLPDSVLTILDNLSYTALSQEEKARYGILYTAGLFKCEKPVESDSLIDQSITYYQNHTNSHQLGKAYYYKGAVHFIKGDKPTCIRCLKQAEELCPTDTLLQNKINEVLYYANFSTDCADLSLEYAKRFLKTSLLLQDPELISRALAAISSSFALLQQNDSAMIYIDRCLPMVENLDSLPRAAIYANMAALHYENGDTAGAERFISQSLRSATYPFAYYVRGEIAYSQGDTIRAQECWGQALSTEDLRLKAMIYEQLAQLHAAHGHHAEAYQYASQQAALIQRTYQQMDSKRIVEIQTKIDAERSERKLYTTIIILLTCLLAIQFFVYRLLRISQLHSKSSHDKLLTFSSKIRTLHHENVIYKSEIDRYREEIEAYSLRVREWKSSGRSMQKELEELNDRLIHQQKAVLDRISRGYAIYQSILRQESVTTSSDNDIEALLEFYRIIEQKRYDQWQNDYIGLSHRQYLFMIVNEQWKKRDDIIASILGVSVSSVRSMRTRVNKKRKA